MEYDLRAPAGESSGGTVDFVSTFPMGCPKFHDEDILSTWRLVVETQGPANDRYARGMTKSKSWMLEDKPGHVTHKGQQEGALASNYYVVQRDPEGAGFTATPVGQWVKFRPFFQADAPQTLEEAESMMSNRNQSASRVTRKLAAEAVKVEDAIGRSRAADDEDDEVAAVGRVKKEEEEEGEGFDFEEVFDNDDVAMAEEEEDTVDERMKPKGIKSADEPEDDLDESGKGMRKILRRHQGESDSDSDDDTRPVAPAAAATNPAASLPEDEDNAEDDEDLDAMAASMPVRQQHREPTPAGGTRRGRSTPGSEEDEDIPLAKKMKKPNPSPAPLVANIKAEKTPPPATAAVAKPSGLTKESVIALLKQCKKLQTADLIKKVKEMGIAALKTAEEKTTLSGIVKEVARMEEHPPGSGKRYIVLRQKFQ